MQQQTILVMGGAGFIGSALVRLLIQATNASVITVDDLNGVDDLEALALALGHPRHHLIPADRQDTKALTDVLSTYQPTAVIHLTQASPAHQPAGHIEDFIHAHVLNTRTLLEAVQAYWATLNPNQQAHFRLLHGSTDEVYGDNGPCTEQSPLTPATPFATGHVRAEHLVHAWSSRYQIPTLIARLSRAYGPYQPANQLIPRTIAQALAGQPITAVNSRQHDWLYVEDHARALYQVLTQGRVGEIYNVGGHNPRSDLEVIKSLCILLENLYPPHPAHPQQVADVKHPAIRRYRDLITHLDALSQPAPARVIDVRKLRAELNWRPRENFESGLVQTIKWRLTPHEQIAEDATPLQNVA